MNIKEKLEKNPKLLEQLRTRQRTNRDVAQELGCHETYLSKVLKQIGVGKKQGEKTTLRKANSRKASARKEFREELAERVVRGGLSIAKAASLARCSERTMYRYVDMVLNLKSQK